MAKWIVDSRGLGPRGADAKRIFTLGSESAHWTIESDSDSDIVHLYELTVFND